MNKKDLSKLLIEVKAGSDLAFEQFFDHYRDRIYRYISRFIFNTADVEDVLIDTFVKFHEKIEKIDIENNPESYLFSIAHNTAVDFIRRNRLVYSLNEDIRTDSPDPEKDLRQKAGALLEKLPRRYRDYIVLKYFEKYTLEEIAEIKGKSIDSVKSILKRARKKLVKLFTKHFIN